MLKILQIRLQQYENHELPDVQTGFRKGRGTRDQIANIRWIIKKAREFQKKHPWKILQEMGIPHHLTCLLRTCMQVRKQQLELDMEPQTGSKSGKEYVKALYCHPAYLTYMPSTS